MHKILRYRKFSETPKCSPMNFFGTVWQKFIDGETQYPSSLMLKNSRYPKFPDAPKCSPTNFFGTVRQKILTENGDMPPLIHKNLFDTKKFLLENRRIPLQSFSFRSCETKNFDGKSWYPPPPPPLASISFFRTRKILKHRMVPWRSFFSVLWDKKNFRQNREAFLCLKIFDTRILSKHRNVFLRILLALWDKNFSTELSGIPFLMQKIMRYTKFSETPKCSPTNFFGTVWQKVIDGETQYPSSLMLQNFRYSSFSDTPKCYPTKFFGTVRQKFFDGKTWYPPFHQ